MIGSGRGEAPSALSSTELCVPPGRYTLAVLDLAGDGLCCSHGNGFVALRANGKVVGRASAFEREALLSFRAASDGVEPKSAEVQVVVTHDTFPEESSWEVRAQDGDVVMEGDAHDTGATATLEAGTYTFTMCARGVARARAARDNATQRAAPQACPPP